MAFRLKRNQSVPRNIRRVVREQIDRAVKELTDEDLEGKKAVHQTRKRLKKIRGVLRLVRDELGKHYKRENAWYRDTARTLSTARDAQVMVDTLHALLKHSGDHLEPDAVAAAVGEMERRRDAVIHDDDGSDLASLREQTADALGRARQRLDSWPLTAGGFRALSPGLLRTYDRGRQEMESAYRQPTPEQFHEWRKRVKYHWYHVRLLRDIWRGPMGAYASELKTLSEYLGDDHDLWVLRGRLLEEPEAFGGEREVGMLADLIDARSARLRSDARTLGLHIYAEKPERFVRRLAVYWRAWRADAGGSDADPGEKKREGAKMGSAEVSVPVVKSALQ